MEQPILSLQPAKDAKITTIKLSRETKARLDHLRVHPRETYEEILQRILQILSFSRFAPEQARGRLMEIEKQHKRLRIGKTPRPQTSRRQHEQHR